MPEKALITLEEEDSLGKGKGGPNSTVLVPRALAANAGFHEDDPCLPLKKYGVAT